MIICGDAVLNSSYLHQLHCSTYSPPGDCDSVSRPSKASGSGGASDAMTPSPDTCAHCRSFLQRRSNLHPSASQRLEPHGNRRASSCHHHHPSYSTARTYHRSPRVEHMMNRSSMCSSRPSRADRDMSSLLRARAQISHAFGRLLKSIAVEVWSRCATSAWSCLVAPHVHAILPCMA